MKDYRKTSKYFSISSPIEIPCYLLSFTEFKYFLPSTERRLKQWYTDSSNLRLWRLFEDLPEFAYYSWSIGLASHFVFTLQAQEDTTWLPNVFHSFKRFSQVQVVCHSLEVCNNKSKLLHKYYQTFSILHVAVYRFNSCLKCSLLWSAILLLAFEWKYRQ